MANTHLIVTLYFTEENPACFQVFYVSKRLKGRCYKRSMAYYTYIKREGLPGCADLRETWKVILPVKLRKSCD